MANQEQAWSDLLAAPRDFFQGLLGGLFGALLALVGAIGLVYSLTGQLPSIKEVRRRDGERNVAIVLAPQAEARASWVRFSGDLRGAMLDLKARRQSR